jgi:hypothetical protein
MRRWWLGILGSKTCQTRACTRALEWKCDSPLNQLTGLMELRLREEREGERISNCSCCLFFQVLGKRESFHALLGFPRKDYFSFGKMKISG